MNDVAIIRRRHEDRQAPLLQIAREKRLLHRIAGAEQRDPPHARGAHRLAGAVPDMDQRDGHGGGYLAGYLMHGVRADRQALRAGAAGYLLKDSATAELAQAFDAIRHGETYLSPSISSEVMARHLQRQSDPRAEATKSLTPRMREILQLIAEGRSTKEIAFLLNLSVKTIETHRMHLMARLDIHEVAGLVRYAVRTGLITAEK